LLKSIKIEGVNPGAASLATKVESINYQDREMAFEFWQKSSDTNLSGLSITLYYFSEGTFISAISLSNSGGGVGHLTATNSNFNFTRNTIHIPANKAADQIQLEFKITSSVVSWWIARPRFY
jgi:hypothetical protein